MSWVGILRVFSHHFTCVFPLNGPSSLEQLVHWSLSVYRGGVFAELLIPAKELGFLSLEGDIDLTKADLMTSKWWWFRLKFTRYPGTNDHISHQQKRFKSSTQKCLGTLRILTPPMETPDPPNDTPGASKQVVLTPHDIPRILRVGDMWSFPGPGRSNLWFTPKEKPKNLKING